MRTRALYNAGLLYVLLWATGGCGDGTGNPAPPPRDANSNTNTNADDDADGGTKAVADASVVDADGQGPLLSLLAPSSETDPEGMDVIQSRTVTVRCQVKKGDGDQSGKVDIGSIALRMVGPDGEEVTATAINALPDDIYESEFTLSALGNGVLRFICEASDDSDPVHTSRASVDTMLDLGPSLEVISPLSGSSHALKSPVTIEFFATAAPLTENDPLAEVTQVAVNISGIRAQPTATADTMRAGRFTLSVDFDNRDLFGAPPETAEITLRVENERGVTREQRIHISLDSTGPAIVVNSPIDRAVTRGEVLINVEVNDPSGVKDDALLVIIDDKDPDKRLEITDWEIDGNAFQQQFDTRHFDSTRTQLTLNVRAKDAVGNQSSTEVTIRLDNVPPLVSLDPPALREWHDVDDDKDWCTQAFDPVGDAATNDLDFILDRALLRALVWDQTNGTPSSLARWYAGVDEDSVRLFYRPADGVPLLVDHTDDGDTRCNEINYSDFTELISTADDPHFYGFEPVTPHGNALPDHAFTEPSGFCLAAPPGSEDASEPRCNNSEMPRVVPQPLESKPPGIYAFLPTNGTTSTCDGEQIALSENLQAGWICLAMRAEDTIGNVGVSQPLRVCLEDLGACTSSPPSCTDGCTLPDTLAKDLVVRYR